MIQPSRRMLLLLGAAVAFSLLPVLAGASLWPVWAVAAGLALAAFLVDVVLAPPPRRFALEVDAPGTLGIGTGGTAVFDLRCGSRRAGRVRMEALLDLHEDLEAQPVLPVRMEGGAVRFGVPLVGRLRGRASIDALWIRWTGPLRLAVRMMKIPVGHSVEIVPDIEAVREAAIRWFRHRDLTAGQRAMVYAGDGSEFDALREFQAGHDPRALDWKASARLRRLLVRDFRAERNHQVVVGIDCGQLMREPVDGIPRLDHAINAGLLLSYACLKTGDRIGMFAFDAKMRRWIAPASGMGMVTRLQRECASLEYAPVETNFVASLTDMAGRLRRRTLIVLFTNFWDSVTAELMVESIGRIARRHLILFAALQDAELVRVGEGAVSNREDLERAVVAQELLHERSAVMQRLRNLGVHVVHVRAQDAPGAVVSAYLRIHRRELL